MRCESGPGEVTRLLERATRGKCGAIDKLLPPMYGELELVARSFIRRERPEHTLQKAAVVLGVSETTVKLGRAVARDWLQAAVAPKS